MSRTSLNTEKPPPIDPIQNTTEKPHRSNLTSPSRDAFAETDTYRYFILKTDEEKKKPQLKKAGRVFVPRTSRLDNETLLKGEGEPFRGFFTLFWTAMGYYLITSSVEAYQMSGEVLKKSFFNWVVQDGWNLLLADSCMLASMFVCVLMQKALQRKWFKRQTTGWKLQVVWELCFFFGAVAWSRYRNWPFIQTAFFTMHALAMTLKIHSYLCHNGDLAILLDSYETFQKHLEHLKTLKDSGENVNEAEIKEVEQDLKHMGICLYITSPARYPNNVTMGNFFDFLLVPSMVYQLEYPRCPTFRPLYLLEKVFATAATFFLMYVTVEKYIHPVFANINEMNPALVLMKLIFPFMLAQLMSFYIIFECICNGFAEITRFADRNFYDDWWNSSSFEEYARKWNKPVHEFLFRHVYLDALHHLHFSKDKASMFTFLVSSILHELVIGIVTRKFRMYFFLLQMSQIPLIQMSRHPWLRGKKVAGNVFFWASMFLGPPLLGVLYGFENFFPF